MIYKDIINSFHGEGHAELTAFRESPVGQALLMAAEKRRRQQFLALVSSAMQSADAAVVKAAVAYLEMSQLVTFMVGREVIDEDSSG